MRVRAHDLMRVNVGIARGYERLVVVSACLVERPILERIITERDFVVYVCPESTHTAMISYRVLCILAYSQIKKLAVVTVDGSPYCITLHYMAEEIARRLAPGVSVEHLVAEAGELTLVDAEVVKLSRHLRRLARVRERLREKTK